MRRPVLGIIFTIINVRKQKQNKQHIACATQGSSREKKERQRACNKGKEEKQ